MNIIEELKKLREEIHLSAKSNFTVDVLIGVIESHGLGWSIEHLGDHIEARIWNGDTVVGQYRPKAVERMFDMLFQAMLQVDWSRLEEKQAESQKA